MSNTSFVLRIPGFVVLAATSLATAHCGSTTATSAQRADQTPRSEPADAASASTEPEPVASSSPAPNDATPSARAAVRPTRPDPIDPALPSITVEEIRSRIERAQHANSGLSVPQVCPRATCRIASDGPGLATGLARDDAALVPPAHAWFQIVEPGASVEIARDRSVDLIGIVLAGRASVRKLEQRTAHPPAGAAWDAFLLPEAGAVIRSADDHPTALVLISARDASSSSPPPATTRRTNTAITLRPIAQQPVLTWAGGAAHDRIVFEAPESPRASLGVLTMSPQLGVPEHRHETSWELLAMLSADGSLLVGAHSTPGSSARPENNALAYHFGGGSIAYVPAGVPHAWQPGDQPDENGYARAATQPLIGIQVYAGPGPEQRFRALAAAAH